MKNLKLFIMALSFIVLWSCEEDTIRPLIQDNGVAPGIVENVIVENLPGAARLEYDLPSSIESDDLLYIQAEYRRTSNGELNVVRSSVFNNEILVEGFGTAGEFEVTLYAVDQSENKSDPITVVVNPTTPPIDTLCKSVEINEDFGGIAISWENPSREPISITVYADNEFGVLEQKFVYFSTQVTDTFKARGFEAEPRRFSVVVEDKFGNICDLQEGIYTPLFEQLIDKNLHEPLSLPHDTPDAFGWVMNNMFDDSITGNGFHTPQGWTDDDPLPEYGDLNPHIFTFDIGVLVKLSRFKWWQRQGTWIYYHGNPRYYEIWGAAELNVDGSFVGWTKIAENQEVIRPSGLEIRDQPQEDIDAAAVGETVEIDASVEPIRYVRFVNIQSWSATSFVHIMEWETYGQIVE